MRARLFRNGGCQAVRLPAQFRFEGTEVEVHRDLESAVLELDALFEGLYDTSPAEPVDFP